MTNRRSPRFATWLLKQTLAGPKNDSLIGDLSEQYQRGHSVTWYWRQALFAIGASVGAQAWNSLWLVVAVVGVAFAFPLVYPYVLGPVVVAINALWYRKFINWTLRNAPGFTWRLPYLLHMWALTKTMVVCVSLASVTWLLVRLFPKRRSLVLTVFLLANVAACMPSLWFALEQWRGQPLVSIWSLNVLWFSLFAFVTIPFSILAGGRRSSIA